MRHVFDFVLLSLSVLLTVCGEQPRYATLPASQLKVVLDTANADVRFDVIAAMEADRVWYPELLPRIAGLLGDPDRYVRNVTYRLLLRHGKGGAAHGYEVQHAVGVRLATSSDDDERWMAAHLLGSLGAIAHEAMPLLIHALEDSSADVRAAAAWALGSAGDSSGMRALAVATQDRFEAVRAEAVESIVKVAPAETLTFTCVHHALHDPSALVRERAAFASLGLANESWAAWNDIATDLSEALADSAALVRKAATAAVKRMGTPESVMHHVLQRALSDSSVSVRRQAKRALDAMEVVTRGSGSGTAVHAR